MDEQARPATDALNLALKSCKAQMANKIQYSEEDPDEFTDSDERENC